MTQIRGRREGQKRRVQRTGGQVMQAGDRYGAIAAMKQITGKGNGANSPREGGAPFYYIPGCRVARGAQSEVEFRETPFLRPCGID